MRSRDDPVGIFRLENPCASVLQTAIVLIDNFARPEGLWAWEFRKSAAAIAIITIIIVVVIAAVAGIVILVVAVAVPVILVRSIAFIVPARTITVRRGIPYA